MHALDQRRCVRNGSAGNRHEHWDAAAGGARQALPAAALCAFDAPQRQPRTTMVACESVGELSTEQSHSGKARQRAEQPGQAAAAAGGGGKHLW